MRGKGFVIKQFEQAADAYFSASDDTGRVAAVSVLETLISILETPYELPFRLYLRYYNICQDASFRNYENAFSKCFQFETI